MFSDSSSREASPRNERSLDCSHPLVCNFQIRERSSCIVLGGSIVLVGFFSIKRTVWIWVLLSSMAMKMKGIYKGFKCISQLFAVVKEREMEIGYPTDVKHVAHIGWEGSSGSAPCWMSEFKAGAELLSPRPSSFGNARNSSSFFSTSSSTDFDKALSNQAIATTLGTAREVGDAADHLPNIHQNTKKNSRKKKSSSSTSSPRSMSSSSRSSRSNSTYKSTTTRLL